MKLRLVSIDFSNRANKKYMVTFNDGTKVHFGNDNYSDFTEHKDYERRRLYRLRHQHDKLDNPKAPGALSWYILWSLPNLNDGIRLYKKTFDL